MVNVIAFTKCQETEKKLKFNSKGRKTILY